MGQLQNGFGARDGKHNAELQSGRCHVDQGPGLNRPSRSRRLKGRTVPSTNFMPTSGFLFDRLLKLERLFLPGQSLGECFGLGRSGNVGFCLRQSLYDPVIHHARRRRPCIIEGPACEGGVSGFVLVVGQGFWCWCLGHDVSVSRFGRMSRAGVFEVDSAAIIPAAAYRWRFGCAAARCMV